MSREEEENIKVKRQEVGRQRTMAARRQYVPSMYRQALYRVHIFSSIKTDITYIRLTPFITSCCIQFTISIHKYMYIHTHSDAELVDMSQSSVQDTISEDISYLYVSVRAKCVNIRAV